MTDLMIAPQVADPDLQQEEPKEAHYVSKEDQMRGYVMGDPIRALCGKVWVPSRSPDRLPVCHLCKEMLSLAQRAGSN